MTHKLTHPIPPPPEPPMTHEFTHNEIRILWDALTEHIDNHDGYKPTMRFDQATALLERFDAYFGAGRRASAGVPRLTPTPTPTHS